MLCLGKYSDVNPGNGLNVMSPPKSYVGNSNSQYDDIWKQGIWEVIRSSGRVLMNGVSGSSKKRPKTSLWSHMRTLSELLCRLLSSPHGLLTLVVS